jgi:hypothetical protein
MHGDMGRCLTAGPQPAWADCHQPQERGRQEGDGRGVVAGQPCCLTYPMCGGIQGAGGGDAQGIHHLLLGGNNWTGFKLRHTGQRNTHSFSCREAMNPPAGVRNR